VSGRVGSARAGSVVSVAREQVSILTVCRLVGMSVPDSFQGGSVKVSCPFGWVNHPDGGHESAFRIYPSSNSAWCFVCQEYYDSPKLYAAVRDITREEAAVVLLDEVGYKPLDLAHLWEQVSRPPVVLDTSSLAEALKVYCSRLSSRWEQRQFESGVAAGPPSSGAQVLVLCSGRASSLRVVVVRQLMEG
jgi:hypothetical protein